MSGISPASNSPSDQDITMARSPTTDLAMASFWTQNINLLEELRANISYFYSVLHSGTSNGAVSMKQYQSRIADSIWSDLKAT